MLHEISEDFSSTLNARYKRNDERLFFGNCSQIPRWKATHAPNLIIFPVYIWNSWKQTQNQRLKSTFSTPGAVGIHRKICQVREIRFRIFKAEKKQSSRQIAVFDPRSSIPDFIGNHHEMFSIRHLAHVFFSVSVHLFHFLFISFSRVYFSLHGRVCRRFR